MSVVITDGQSDLMLLTTAGKAVRFKESCLRAVGRTAQGVRGVKLGEGQFLITAITVEDNDTLLLATTKGYGKCVSVSAFRCSNRDTQGVRALPITKASERNGQLVAAMKVDASDEEVMLISDKGTLVRIPLARIPVVGRAAIGVRLIRLRTHERLVGIESIGKLKLPLSDIGNHKLSSSQDIG